MEVSLSEVESELYEGPCEKCVNGLPAFLAATGSPFFVAGDDPAQARAHTRALLLNSAYRSKNQNELPKHRTPPAHGNSIAALLAAYGGNDRGQLVAAGCLGATCGYMLLTPIA